MLTRPVVSYATLYKAVYVMSYSKFLVAVAVRKLTRYVIKRVTNDKANSKHTQGIKPKILYMTNLHKCTPHFTNPPI